MKFIFFCVFSFVQSFLLSQNCLSKRDFSYINKNPVFEVKKYLKDRYYYSTGNDVSNSPSSCVENVVFDIFEVNEFGFDGVCYGNNSEYDQFFIYQIKNKSPIYIYKCDQYCFNSLYIDCKKTLNNEVKVSNQKFTTKSFVVSGTTLEFRTYFDAEWENYVVFYNKSQVQAIVSEKLKKIKQLELEKELENKKQLEIQLKFNSLIANANDLFESGKYSEAKTLFQEANNIIPSSEIAHEIQRCDELLCMSIVNEGDRLLQLKLYNDAIFQYEKSKKCMNDIPLIELKINNVRRQILQDSIAKILNLATIHFNNKNYFKAKELYLQILTIDNNNIEANKGVYEVNNIFNFLAERKEKTYDFSTFDNINYKENQLKFKNGISDFIALSNQGQLSIVFDFYFDTLGVNQSTYSLEGASRKRFQSNFNQITNSFYFNAPVKSGMNVKAKKSDKYEINWETDYGKYRFNSKKIKHKKGDNNYSTEIRSFISKKAIYGNYYFENKSVMINADTFHVVKFHHYKAKAGPLNVVYSMVLPGLGTKRVTYGEKGTGRMIGFLITGALAYSAKMYSDQQYKKYVNTQGVQAMIYYDNANLANKLYISSLGLAATFYVYDFFYVLGKGFKNIKNNKLLNNQRNSLPPIFIEDINLNKN